MFTICGFALTSNYQLLHICIGDVTGYGFDNSRLIPDKDGILGSSPFADTPFSPRSILRHKLQASGLNAPTATEEYMYGDLSPFSTGIITPSIQQPTTNWRI